MELVTLYAQMGKLGKEIVGEPTHEQVMAAVEIALRAKDARKSGQTDMFGVMSIWRALNCALKDQPGKRTFLIDPRY